MTGRAVKDGRGREGSAPFGKCVPNEGWLNLVLGPNLVDDELQLGTLEILDRPAILQQLLGPRHAEDIQPSEGHEVPKECATNVVSSLFEILVRRRRWARRHREGQVVPGRGRDWRRRWRWRRLHLRATGCSGLLRCEEVYARQCDDPASGTGYHRRSDSANSWRCACRHRSCPGLSQLDRVR